jgi:hypothetical protein
MEQSYGGARRSRVGMTASRVRAAAVAAIAIASVAAPRAQTDLDALMRQVLAVRDENWKKLQQYVLDERESIDVRGPANMPIWGERREYTWFIRNGFFVRSPLKFNGVEISEGDRRKFEAEYLERQQEREKRRLRNQSAADAPPPATDAASPTDLESVLRQTRQPQFISSAYFLRFRFEEGKYALVDRERSKGATSSASSTTRRGCSAAPTAAAIVAARRTTIARTTPSSSA